MAVSARVYTANSNSLGVPWTLPNASVTTNGMWSALDAATGQLLWQTTPPHGGVTSGPATTANGVVFGCSLESTLNALALPGAIRAAILHREGALGGLLSVIEALEDAQWQQVETLCEKLPPLTLQEVARMGLAAGAWAGVADRSAQGLERIEE